MPNKNRPFDFCGWATVNNVKCSDGRTIRKNAFIENDGEEVPLVWQHLHNDPENVLGHALLENHDEGVYCYAWFNNNPKAQAAKEAAGNGDIKALSIYANQLVQRGSDVVHGMIREVSLVLTGANKGARIENLNFAHSDGTYDTDDEEALIFTDEQDIALYHNDGHDPAEDIDGFEGEEDPEEDEDFEDEDDEVAEDDGEEDEEDNEEMSIQEVLDGMTDEQLAVANALYEQGQIDALQEVVDDVEEGDDEEDEDLEDEEYEEDEDEGDEEFEDDDEEEDEVEHSMYGGYGSMKHNVFDNDEKIQEDGNSLSHAETEAIFADAKRSGSLKEAFLAHTDEYGITNIDFLFPDYKNTSATPEFIKRDQNWVAEVMASIHHSPFTRIKTVVADITADEARALGYIKPNKKKEEVFTLLKRTTDPQTIYKKQKLDRDDVVDITDFDVVAWIKGEMRLMLDEEIARAILIGDGRATDSPDHINQQHVRSIWKDDDLYTVKVPVTAVQGEDFAKTTIKEIIRNRKNYKGSGNPVFFTTEEVVTEMLLLEDGMGHFMYKTVNELATQLRVSKIITVPVMENAGTRTTTGNNPKVYDLIGLIVNLTDYNVGADKGGSVNMFDDFDIDYNQQKYLIETRISGALVKPYAALAIEKEHTNP